MTKYEPHVDTETDEILVTAAKRGDGNAFDRLMRRYEHRMLRLARQIIRNREDAEDAVQEAFQKVFLHIHRFEEKSRFSTWLTRIAINECFMSIRRRRAGREARPTGEDGASILMAESIVDRAPNPEVVCWRKERAVILRRAIRRLSENSRRTISLRSFEERTVRETAEIMGTSIGAVKARSFHSQRRLRSILAPKLLADLRSSRPMQTERL